jgi:hypothetical protein
MSDLCGWIGTGVPNGRLGGAEREGDNQGRRFVYNFYFTRTHLTCDIW